MTMRLVILLALFAAAAVAGAMLAPRFAGAIVAGAGVAAVLLYLYERSARTAQRLRTAVAGLAREAGLAPPRGGGAEDLAATIGLAGQRLSAALAAQREEAARAAGAMAALPDPVLVVDGGGRALLANPALGALAGVEPLGRTLEELFPASELPRLVASAGAGEATAEQITLRRAGGPRMWEVGAAAVPGVAGPLVALAFRDVTEGARALQVRTDFVANASHELRTPIAAIRMAMETLDLAGPDGGGEAMRARVLSMVQAQVARLEELVRDLLDLSRLESEAEVRHEAVDVRALVGAVGARLASALAERRLTLEAEVTPGAETIRSDGRLLELIVGNLVDNSAKFAFEGTAVRVRARPARGAVVLEVIDRGIGIPLDQQQRVFERFYQVDPSRTGGGARRGSGLGLAIVKHAVRRLGGSIRVQSVWQQGTTMTVELPGAAG